jgi:hypothetical protein
VQNVMKVCIFRAFVVRFNLELKFIMTTITHSQIHRSMFQSWLLAWKLRFFITFSNILIYRILTKALYFSFRFGKKIFSVQLHIQIIASYHKYYTCTTSIPLFLLKSMVIRDNKRIYEFKLSWLFLSFPTSRNLT